MARITQQFIQKLVTGTRTAKLVYDDGVPGFCVRLTPRADGGAAATYAFDYYFRGKKRRRTIGKSTVWSVDAARDEARKFRTMIDNKDNKVDPLKAHDALKSEPTFTALAADWLSAASYKRESSLYDDRRMLGMNEDGTRKDDEDEAQGKKRILSALGEKRLTEIDQSDIDQLHDSLRDTPYQANRVLALLSAIFNYGLDKPKWKKWIQSNPAKGIKKFDEAKRERWLTIEELQKFREALDKYRDQSAANVLRLLLLTGSRASEALKARWEEFDLQRGVWTKPSHHTKQKKVEYVPLSTPALKLLESIAPENPSGPLFPGRERGATRVSLKRPWIAACRAAGLVEEYFIDGKRDDKDGNPVKLKRYRPTVRVHDLRHNFASHLASNGVSLQVVGKLLGHTQASTTMRYAHLQDAPLRDAANQFGRIFTEVPKARKRRG